MVSMSMVRTERVRAGLKQVMSQQDGVKRLLVYAPVVQVRSRDPNSRPLLWACGLPSSWSVCRFCVILESECP